ncbi:MAG TPA: hypothetical protein VFD92_19315 [Candidatus Binatia bacterium]|nr:hypothetical protein [Candidatus Binatia bacterium]
MRRLFHRSLAALVLCSGILALAAQAEALDMCFQMDTGGKFIAKGFKIPSRGKCKNFVGYFPGEFAPDVPVNGTACTTSDGSVARFTLSDVGYWYQFSFYLPLPGFAGVETTDNSGNHQATAFHFNSIDYCAPQSIR